MQGKDAPQNNEKKSKIHALEMVMYIAYQANMTYKSATMSK